MGGSEGNIKWKGILCLWLSNGKRPGTSVSP